MNPVDLLSVNDGMHSAVNVQKEPVIPAVGQVEKNTGRIRIALLPWKKRAHNHAATIDRWPKWVAKMRAAISPLSCVCD